MQPLNAVNDPQASGYRDQVELERWCRAIGAGRNLGSGWEKAASNYLGQKVTEIYLQKVDEMFDQIEGKVAKYGAMSDLFKNREQVRQVAVESLLYVLGNLHEDRGYNQMCGAIGKRAEYVLWLTHPKWGKSWHLDGLRLATHNDLGMKQLMAVFKKKYFRYNVDYEPLSTVQRVALGSFFLESMVLGTRLIEIETVISPRRNKIVRHSMIYWEFLKRWRQNILMFRPLYMPMLMPPRPYTEHHDGGYCTIETPCSTVDWSEFNGIVKNSSPVVMRALNRLQEEPFRLDWSQLGLLQECWDRGHAIGDLPSQVRLEEPQVAEGQRRTHDEWKKAWAYKADQKRNAVRARFVHALVAAERVAEHSNLWFVWQMDHRGRLYPRGSQINFGAGDTFRSMLQLEQRSPVKGHEQELSWHLGSAYGLPPSHSIRWDWFRQNQQLIQRVGLQPMEHLAHWADAKEPWRYVQICRDWGNYVLDPGYQTGTVYRLDQTTSGYGHVACLIRDERLARFTNVIGDQASDLYTGVSRLMKQHIEQIIREEEDERRRLFLEWWLQHWPERALWKKIVMPIVYGRTYKTLRDQLGEYLRDDICNFLTDEGYRIYELSHVFAGIVHRYVKELLPGLTDMVRWLGKMAEMQMDQNIRPSWITPNGMLVQSYRTQGKEAQINLTINRRAYRYHVVDHVSGVLDRRKSKRQLGADFVHSMDAAFLQQFVCHWGDALNKPIVTVHDCFGTTLEHVGTMRRELNDQWHRFYSVSHLMRHHQWIEKTLGDEAPLPPCVGTLDPSRIGENPFLFS